MSLLARKPTSGRKLTSKEVGQVKKELAQCAAVARACSKRVEAAAVPAAPKPLPPKPPVPEPTSAILDEFGGFEPLLARILGIAASIGAAAPGVVPLMQEFCRVVEAVSSQNVALASSTGWFDIGQQMQLPAPQLAPLANNGTVARRLVMSYCREMGSPERIDDAVRSALDTAQGAPLTDAMVDRALWFARRGALIGRGMEILLRRNTWNIQIQAAGAGAPVDALQHLINADQTPPIPAGALTAVHRSDVYQAAAVWASVAGLNAFAAAYPPTQAALEAAFGTVVAQARVPLIRAVAAHAGAGPALAPLPAGLQDVAFESLNLFNNGAGALAALYAAMGANAPNEAARLTGARNAIHRDNEPELAATIGLYGPGLNAIRSGALVGFAVEHSTLAVDALAPFIAAMSQAAVDAAFDYVTQAMGNVGPGGPPNASNEPEWYARLARAFGAGTTRPTQAALDRAYRYSGRVMAADTRQMAAAVASLSLALGPPSGIGVAWQAMNPLLATVQEALTYPRRRMLRPPPYAVDELMQALGAYPRSAQGRQWRMRFAAIDDNRGRPYAELFQ